jgi:pyruvate/2-oxoglutarate dehydrogenase complex dihydrolipoamide acyltransferase (E2) component
MKSSGFIIKGDSMIEIKMPNLGMTMLEGIVAEWKKVDGAAVDKGDELVEVTSETGKLNLVIEAKEAGILKIILPKEGRIECGGVIGTIS